MNDILKIFHKYIQKVKQNPKIRCSGLSEQMALEINTLSLNLKIRKLTIKKKVVGPRLKHKIFKSSNWVVHYVVLVGDVVYDPWYGKPLPLDDYSTIAFLNSNSEFTLKISDFIFLKNFNN